MMKKKKWRSRAERMSESGAPGHAVEGAIIFVPDDASLRIKNGGITYLSPRAKSGGARLVEKRIDEPADVLDRFVRLESESDIIDFARDFGTLWLCRHRLPAEHPTRPFSILGSYSVVNLKQDCAGAVDPEPIGWWHQYISRARQLLETAAKVRGKKRPADDEWGKLDAFTTETRRAQGMMPGVRGAGWLDDPWWRLAENVNWWLDLTGVAPHVVAERKTLRTRFWSRNRGVLGLLAIQLLLAVTHSEGLVTCSGCGATYIARRQPIKGKRNYCLECKENRVPARDAARDYRARKEKTL